MRRTPVALAPALMVSALTAVPACGDRTKATPIAVERGTWTMVQKEIVAGSCAFASCHGGAQPAARLDLSGPSACNNLVTHSSCLFPARRLVSPGKPDDSFLLAKLTGEGLAAQPDVVCGTATNRRMPFGAPALSAEQLAIVSSWIAAGADCQDGTSPGAPEGGSIDAGSPEAGSPDDGLPPADTGAEVTAAAVGIASISPARSLLLAGQRGVLDVTLTQAAGASGATVVLEISDGTVAGVPATVIVPAGQGGLKLMVVGKRPGSARVMARAGAGTAPVGADLLVTGLLFTEVLPAGWGVTAGSSWLELANVSDAPIDLGGYRVGVGVEGFAGVTVMLAGILAPGGCFVVGGPESGPGNGTPRYGQPWDFSAVVLGSAPFRQQAMALGLFDAKVDVAAQGAVPIDAVAFGGGAATGLVGPDGAELPLAGPEPPAGHSLRRTAASTWRDNAAPTPGDCRRP